MIRRAVAADFPSEYPTESALRIGGLKEAYGIDVPFIQFFTDGEGSLLSVMDGVGVFYAAVPITEEWESFIAFYPSISRLHTDEKSGNRIANNGGWQEKSGVVLHFEGEAPSVEPPVTHAPSLPAVHTLLSACFDSFPPLESWYVDVSHRVRHGHCLVAAVMDEEKPVSVALTVAQAGRGALLGQVATHADYRRRGYAGLCINSLIYRLQGKDLYILPANDTAASLYKTLGFCPCGGWAELTRI
ncbi:MAG: GNAT family N-acetyltransferase [Clostridia bacterium]|nr:GNAT family N-acetyltransferase [Clostridia bacterium]